MKIQIILVLTVAIISQRVFGQENATPCWGVPVGGETFGPDNTFCSGWLKSVASCTDAATCTVAYPFMQDVGLCPTTQEIPCSDAKTGITEFLKAFD